MVKARLFLWGVLFQSLHWCNRLAWGCFGLFGRVLSLRVTADLIQNDGQAGIKVFLITELVFNAVSETIHFAVQYVLVHGGQLGILFRHLVVEAERLVQVFQDALERLPQLGVVFVLRDGVVVTRQQKGTKRVERALLATEKHEETDEHDGVNRNNNVR